MKMRPLVIYTSFTLASFALTLGAVAQATTFAARYPGVTCALSAGLGCPFDTGSAFPVSSMTLTQVTVDYYVKTATSGPSFQLCSYTTIGAACSSSSVTGFGSVGGHEIIINDHTRLSVWEDETTYKYLVFDHDFSNINLNGYKVNGN